MKYVKCTYSIGKITKGELYAVYCENEHYYRIMIDDGSLQFYSKLFFKPVDPQGEISKMKKFTKCTDNAGFEPFFIIGKNYEILLESGDLLKVVSECGPITVHKNVFRDQATIEKESVLNKKEDKFKFIPLKELNYVYVNGVKGILIKE